MATNYITKEYLIRQFQNFTIKLSDIYEKRFKEWKPSIEYKVGDIVYIDNKIYKTITNHTSGTTFEQDLSDNKWLLIVDGGNGSSISNYIELQEKPKVNGVELVGNKSAQDLGLVSTNEFINHSNNHSNPHETSIENLTNTAISNLLDKQTLVYDINTGTWKNDSIVVTETGKIKLNASTTLDYLDKFIDNNTIQIENNKLIVKTIDGLTLSVTEINGLKDKIDAISSAGMNYTGTVPTKADLNAITSASNGETKIVLVDETQGNKKMTYIFDGTSWESLGEFSVEIRDFTVDKINLTTEVTGTLPQANMDLTGLAKTTDLVDYIDKATYDTNSNGIIDKAETLEGLTKSVDELNNSLTVDDLLAGNNVTITKNSNGTITINSTATSTGGDSANFESATSTDIQNILSKGW